MTPVGTSVNLMVHDPGRYQFGDQWKLGLVVLLWSLGGAVFIAPLYCRFGSAMAKGAEPWMLR